MRQAMRSSSERHETPTRASLGTCDTCSSLLSLSSSWPLRVRTSRAGWLAVFDVAHAGVCDVRGTSAEKRKRRATQSPWSPGEVEDYRCSEPVLILWVCTPCLQIVVPVSNSMSSTATRAQLEVLLQDKALDRDAWLSNICGCSKPSCQDVSVLTVCQPKRTRLTCSQPRWVDCQQRHVSKGACRYRSTPIEQWSV